jgi:chemotaxis protein MotB
VVRLLTSGTSIPPERMISVGYGEYRPIADNSTEEGRTKNRRIDIIVLSEKYNALEQSLAY